MPRAAPQITYAAHDAWLSRELLLELHRRYNEDRGQQEQRHGSNGHMEQEQQQGGAAGPWPPAITLQAGAAAATPERASGAGAPGTPGVSYPAPAPGADPNVGRSVSSGRQVSVLELVAPFMDTFGGIKTKRVDKALGPAAGAAVAAAAATDAAARLRAAVGNAPSMQGNGGGSSSVSLSGDGSRAGGGGGANGRNKADRKLPTRKSVLYENCRLLVRGVGVGGVPGEIVFCMRLMAPAMHIMDVAEARSSGRFQVWHASCMGLTFCTGKQERIACLLQRMHSSGKRHPCPNAARCNPRDSTPGGLRPAYRCGQMPFFQPERMTTTTTTPVCVLPRRRPTARCCAPAAARRCAHRTGLGLVEFPGWTSCPYTTFLSNVQYSPNLTKGSTPFHATAKPSCLPF